MPEFGRLEYRTVVGWIVGHAGLGLQNPQRYVNALADRVKDKQPAPVFARFIPLDETFSPGPAVVPDTPFPAFHETPPPGVPVGKITECAVCAAPHKRKFECLL